MTKLCDLWVGVDFEFEGFRWCLLEYTGEEAIATKILYDHDCIVTGNPICSFDLDTDVKHIKRLTIKELIEDKKKGIFDGVKLEEAFELFDEGGNYLELGTLYLEEHVEIGTGKIDYYNLRIKLLGHVNTFTPDELKSMIKAGGEDGN